MRPLYRRLLFLLLLLLSIACSGCLVVPMRAPTKTIGTTGGIGKKVDLKFIVPGSTSRQEVLQKLDWLNSGITDDRFFVARWSESTWGVAWAVAANYAADGGWNRSWTIHNLVVEFDAQGLVLKSSLLDDKHLADTLSQLISQDSDESLAAQLPFQVLTNHSHLGKHTSGTLTLAEDELRFAPNGSACPDSNSCFATPRQNILRVSTGSWTSSSSTSPALLATTIHFKQNTSLGTKFSTQLDLPTIVLLLRYVHQPRATPDVSQEGGNRTRAHSPQHCSLSTSSRARDSFARAPALARSSRSVSRGS